jgi:CheY-like chemotaxis protein
MYEEPIHGRRFSADASRECLAEAASADVSLRILLAEDTEIAAEMMLAMAERLDVEMDVAHNGLDAIVMVHEAIAEGRPYSLLLMDAMMPVLDGVETARRLRQEGLTRDMLPIIAVTAATDLDEVRTYRDAGMQAFLEKPVSLEDLRATLKAWKHRPGRTVDNKRKSTLEELQQQFDLRKRTAVAALDAALAGGEFTEECVMELRTLLHKIAGTAGSFGEASLSEDTRALEGELMKVFFDNGDVGHVIARAREILGEAI